MQKFIGNTKEVVYLTLTTLIAIFIRLWWIINIPTRQVFDFETYHDIATNIYLGLGHTYLGEPIAFQGMAYPYALGYVFRIVGSNSILIAKLFNLMLSTLTLILFYFILKKLTNNKRTIFIGYTILALLPNYIAYNNVVGTEVFAAFNLALIIFLQLYNFDNKFRYPMLGIAIGVAALTKPIFLAYPVVATTSYWLKHKQFKEPLFKLVILTLVMTITIAPWTYRNYKRFGRFIPVSYNGGYVFFLNNNANNTHGGWMPIPDAAMSVETRERVNEILQYGARSEKLAHELDPLLQSEAIKWIKANPIQYAKLGIIRLHTTFYGGVWDIDAWTMNELRERQPENRLTEYERNMRFFRSVTDSIIHILSTLTFGYIIINIKPIILSFFKRERYINSSVSIPILNMLFFIAVYFVFEGQARYNFPLLFLMVASSVLFIEKLRG
ncbi:ArnT family glycosyltransferase [Serpentinicella alkaliphila]|uniref:Dolichyl-phosphate-mannose-protein mannosyltransferase n=1 Tax=Serpentinicella alkaliphila TaxID=1734049 RepID=A0A4R2TBA7_9FIRM|nr:glycosyltransferase family 39 protein [Serpentinicella alkaliphila]QUH25057.1 glycosyltransferase family 39 protein [Serpentinicella alkaliphila]TCQ00498.1 dolichyl-phosphate-mannose-protein mannosyltransferase [Serpentinicella alkaliphila]